MRPLKTIAVLVLAAGEGRRMGGPKALMQVGGRPWWMVQRERLEKVRVACEGQGIALRALWVVSEAVASAVGEGLAGAGDMVMAGGSGDAGGTGEGRLPMFHSVRVGIEAAILGGGDGGLAGVFILPVDVPAPEAGVWMAIGIESDGPCVAAHRGERGHPVFLPIGWIKGVFLPAVAAGAGGDETLRLDTLVGAGLRAVEVGSPSVLVNLNTPADVEAWMTG